jgi:hypothetical protein
MKIRGIYRTGIFAGLVMFALAGCADIFRPGTGSGETIPEGMGLARINLNGSGARTAVPGSGGYYYTLDFTAERKPAVNKTLDGGSSLTVTVALEPAVWILEVKGYVDSSKASLKVTGNISVPITAGTEANFEVYLTPDFSSGGTGNLSYNISFSASVRGFLALYPIDDTPGTSQEIDISAGAGGAASGTLSGALPKGPTGRT